MASVPALVEHLCSCIMEDAERRKERGRQTAPFSFHGHLHQVTFSERAVTRRRLYRTAFELLLLRRREWYGRWKSPLSPESRCLASSYLLHQQGRHEAARRLSQATASLLAEMGEGGLPVLELLSILSDVGGDSCEEVRGEEEEGERGGMYLCLLQVLLSLVTKGSPYQFFPR